MDEKYLELENRIGALEQKIDQLLGASRTASPVPTPVSNASNLAPEMNPEAAKTSVEVQRRPSTTELMFGGARSRTKTVSSESASSRLLPLIAVICFVLAGVFIVRLAVDSGWLNTERQWGLLVILGLALTGTGRWFEKIEKAYRTYLSAAGITVLYISAYSASLYFQIVPPSFSLGMAMAVSVVCLALFNYHRSEIFPVLTSIGTYLAPLLLGSRKDLIFDSGYFLLWAVVFSYISNFLKSRTLSLTAAYFALGVFTLRYAGETSSDNLVFILVVMTLQFLCFAYGVFAYSVQNKSPMSEQLSLSYLPVLLFYYGTSYYFLNRWNPELAPWISLVSAGVVYGLYHSAKNQITEVHSQKMVQAFLVVVLMHSGYLEILPSAAKPWLVPVFILLQYISETKDILPKLSPLLRYSFLAVGLIEFSRICYQLILSPDLTHFFPGVLTLALGLFYYFQLQNRIQDKALLFLSMLHLLAVLCLYRIVYDQGSLAVSIAWGVYSALILTVGYQKRDASLAKSSLFVLIAASLKALIYDSSQAPSLVRIGSLLVTGILLYGAGLIFRKIQRWDTSQTLNPDEGK